MIPLYQDHCFTFRFEDDRVIPRFHLDGVAQGQQVTVVQIDPVTQEPLDKLTEATAGVDGWVDLPVPIRVRAGEAFIVVPSPGQ